MRKYLAKLLSSLNAVFIAALLSCGGMAQAAAPDAEDQAAFEKFRQTVIDAQRRVDTQEMALDSALREFTLMTFDSCPAMRSGIPTCPSLLAPDGSPQKPPHITDEEWQAFPEIHPSQEGQDKFPVIGGIVTASYALYDLDRDGQRELLLQTPSQRNVARLHIWRRAGAKFKADDNAVLNLRYTDYGDAHVHWLSLQGRFYLAQFFRQLGRDTVQIFSPLAPAENPFTLSVTYRYQLEKNARLNEKMRQAINRGLLELQRQACERPLPGVKADESCSTDECAARENPVCPMPKAVADKAARAKQQIAEEFEQRHLSDDKIAGAKALHHNDDFALMRVYYDDRLAEVFSYWPYYTFVTFPVKQGKTCQPARLIAERGAYSPGNTGLVGRVVVGAKKLLADQRRAPDDETYAVPGLIRRNVMFIESGYRPRIVK